MTVNQRIVALKEESGMSTQEFCMMANISNGTFNNIQRGENISAKTIRTICHALGLRQTWVLTGEGPKSALLEGDGIAEINPSPHATWKDEAYMLMKEQLKKKDEQISQLMAVFSTLNFRKALDKAAVPFLFPNTKQGAVSGAAA